MAQFVYSVTKGGNVAVLEMMAADLKMQGCLLARTLSYEHAEYELVVRGQAKR